MHSSQAAYAAAALITVSGLIFTTWQLYLATYYLHHPREQGNAMLAAGIAGVVTFAAACFFAGGLAMQ